jgi:hypothetical protein
VTDEQPDTAGNGDAGAEDAAPAASPAPPRLNVSALMERIEESVGSTLSRELDKAVATVGTNLTRELDHAMVALTAIRNSLDAVTGTLKRLEDRIETLEGKPGTPALAPPPVPSMPDEASTRLATIERLLNDVDGNATREILDAIVAVAQHLEAVQTATAWAIVRELRLA